MRLLSLNRDLIERRIGERGLTKSSLSDRLKKNRSTVYRWLRDGWLPTPDRVLQVAGVLDIDPMALWDISSERFPRLLPELTRMSRRNNWKSRMPALAFVEDYFFPDSAWPPASMLKYFGRTQRDWITHNFKHIPSDPPREFYASLLFKPKNGTFHNPQVWHFGYRELGLDAPEEWLPYGAVRFMEGRVELFNYIGVAEMATMEPDADSFVVKTHFGKTPIEFRVASIHPFEMQVIEDVFEHPATVHFYYPGPA